MPGRTLGKVAVSPATLGVGRLLGQSTPSDAPGTAAPTARVVAPAPITVEPSAARGTNPPEPAVRVVSTGTQLSPRGTRTGSSACSVVNVPSGLA